MSKQWRKSSRWRRAKDKHKHNLRNSWRLSSLAMGKSPWRPVSYMYEFLWHTCGCLILNQFAQVRPFPKNMGAKTIRFIRP